MKNKRNGSKSNFWFIPVFSAIIMLILLYLLGNWNSEINENLAKINYQTQNLKNDKLTITLAPEIKKLWELKKDQGIYLSKDQLDTFNKLFEMQLAKVDEKSQFYVSQIQADLNRLNIYTTYAVGFLGIIGALFPIFIGFITKRDIDEKVNSVKGEIDNSKTQLETKITTAETKLDNIANTSKSVEEKHDKLEIETYRLGNENTEIKNNQTELDGRIKDLNSTVGKHEETMKDIKVIVKETSEKIPKISILPIQYEINRIINIDRVRLFNSNNGRKRKSIFLDMLKNISTNLTQLKMNLFEKEEIEKLKIALSDLAFSLSSNSFQTILHRYQLELFNNFITVLANKIDDNFAHDYLRKVDEINNALNILIENIETLGDQ